MKIRKMVRLATGAALLALAGPALSQLGATGPKYGAFGLDLSAQKPSVKPGDDFWTYVNGGWADKVAIAEDRGSVGFGTKLTDEAEVNVRAILDDMAKNPARFGAKGRQVGDLYASWMDEKGIEKRGTAPLKPYLARIAAVKDHAGLEVLFATQGYAGPVGFGILPDPKDTSKYIAAAGQGTLGMARDYYLEQGEKYDAYRKAYRAYVQKIQELAGVPNASAKADAIVALETSIAKVMWSPAESRDILKLYHPADRAEMKKVSSDFDWEPMLATAGLSSMPSLIMANDTAITAIGKIFRATPVQTWKDWMTFQFISSNAQFLPKAFDDTRFDFYSRTLSDIKVQRDRWKRGVQLVNGAVGELVGEIYVARHYPPESSAKMNELIADLRGALEERLAANAWMDDKTKTAARAKLAAFDPRVGHPVKYIDYSALKVARGNPLANAMAAGEFQWKLQLSRLPKPVDRSLWNMTPQTVNAYYNPFMNQITFPAAILQPPYFDPNADPAVNYGAIGAIIGHEIGHGFDDQGSRFDGTGRLANWWSSASTKAFKERTAALGAQYDSYEAIPGVHIKGALTMGENIGDLGGIEMAYAAYQRYQAKHGPAPVIGGLTGDQRFFLSYAQAWQSKLREGVERQRLLTDPHSPPKYRVNGIVRNVDAWYKAFNIQPGDALYLEPEKRVHIW